MSDHVLLVLLAVQELQILLDSIDKMLENLLENRSVFGFMCKG